MDTPNLEDEIIFFLRGKLNPSLIYIFGSYAKGCHRKDSDIDIAYLSDHSISPYERFLLAQELASSLNTDVDLVDLKEATTVFQMQIISSGKVLYCDNEVERLQLEMKVFKEYAKLNEERKLILDEIKERGSIYE